MLRIPNKSDNALDQHNDIIHNWMQCGMLKSIILFIDNFNTLRIRKYVADFE